jgi:hypothetical protein
MPTRWQFIAVTAYLGQCLFGCASRHQDTSMAGPSNVIELDTPDHKLIGSQPAQLKASMGNSSLVDFGFAVGDGGAAIALHGRIPPADLGIGNVTLAITDGPTTDGFAASQISNISGVSSLVGSQLDLVITANHVSGDIRVPGLDQPWSFQGQVFVSCWVPRTALGGTQQPEAGGTNSSDALVADSEFISSACAPMRSWVGR